MKTILAPIDFSPATRDVVQTAVQLAQPLGAHVVLLHSLQPPMITTDYGIGLEILQETLAINEKAAIRQLNHLKTVLTAKGIVADTVLVNGFAATHIVEQAVNLKADYLILGSHGHTALYDLLVGSTTHAVLKKSPCPVIVVPPTHVVKKKPAKKR
jgi:nucleotide-binding universal stress UspA family protein